jgi:hypothetical protein
MGQFELAAMAAKTLASDYSADLSAQVAQARTAIARRDRPSLVQPVEVIKSALKEGSSDSLAWDRRVSLSLVLAQTDHSTLARIEAQRCLDEMGELDLRGLSESTLFRFLTLCKVLGLQIQDASLRSMARELLPPQLRSQI